MKAINGWVRFHDLPKHRLLSSLCPYPPKHSSQKALPSVEQSLQLSVQAEQHKRKYTVHLVTSCAQLHIQHNNNIYSTVVEYNILDDISLTTVSCPEGSIRDAPYIATLKLGWQGKQRPPVEASSKVQIFEHSWESGPSMQYLQKVEKDNKRSREIFGRT